MRPAEIPLPIDQGGSLSKLLRFYFSGTDLSAYAEVWNKNRTERLLQLTPEWLNRHETGSWEKSYTLNGVTTVTTQTVRSTLRLTTTPDLTAAVHEDGVWDLLLIYPDGSRFYHIRGPAPVRLRSTLGPVFA
jgi:hypothetical protein